jgi:hypothetical protein
VANYFQHSSPQGIVMASSILDLARGTLKDAEVLDAYYRANDLQQPSFDINGPGRVKIEDFEVNSAHQRLITSSQELHHLALGPAESLRVLANVRQVSLVLVCFASAHSITRQRIRSLYLSCIDSTLQGTSH